MGDDPYGARRQNRSRHPAARGARAIDRMRAEDRPGAPPDYQAVPSAVWEHEQWLDDRDWAAIEVLLADPGADTASVTEAAEAVERLLDGPVIPTAPLLSPLLDLWCAVHELRPGAGAQVASTLTLLTGRNFVRASEVAAVCLAVRHAVGGGCSPR